MFRISKIQWIILATIFMGSLSYRLFHLDADPVQVESFSNGDEGNYSFNARHHRLYGTYLTTYFNPMALGPLYPIVQSAAAHLNPSPLARYRMVSVLSALLTWIVVVIILAPLLSGSFLSLVSLDLAFNYMSVVHSRYGIPESLMGFWFMMAVFLQAVALTKRKRTVAFATGVVAAIVVGTKTSGLSVFGVLAAACTGVIVQERNRQERIVILKLVGWEILGTLAVLLPIIGFYIGPHFEDWLTTNRFFIGRGATHETPNPKNLLPFFFSYAWGSMPIIFIAAIRSALRFIKRAFSHRLSREEWVYLCAFAGPFFYLGMFPFQPLRWQVLVVPPMVLAAAFELRFIPRWSDCFTVFGLAIVYTIAANAFHGLPWITLHSAGPLVGMGSAPILLTLITILLTSAFCFRRFPKAPALTLLFVDLCFQLYLNRTIVLRYQFTLRDTAQAIGVRLGRGTLSGDGEVNIGLVLDAPSIIARYGLADRENDVSFRKLFMATSIPDYYLLAAVKVPAFKKEAPLLLNCLRPLEELHFDLGSPHSPSILFCHVDRDKLLRAYHLNVNDGQ